MTHAPCVLCPLHGLPTTYADQGCVACLMAPNGLPTLHSEPGTRPRRSSEGLQTHAHSLLEGRPSLILETAPSLPLKSKKALVGFPRLTTGDLLPSHGEAGGRQLEVRRHVPCSPYICRLGGGPHASAKSRRGRNEAKLCRVTRPTEEPESRRPAGQAGGLSL